MKERTMPKLLNHQESADLLGVSIHRFVKWLDRGLVPYVRIGQTRQCDRDTLLEWYEGQMVYPDKPSELSDGGKGE